ncbi:MAG TPA: hypothetical protein VFM98_18155 [Ramlibacter sp.]|uniref:hypothetical protein n=1 Tax=Ramlibacter sp. TaxID=1917967 RepID=UPI002D805636|nr:hypothetical protein [Ramlibacter sp.]HET8747529.1 hypothetical protein [Ramlibacter sp.]
MNFRVRSFLPPLLAAGLLSACGGGVSFSFVDDDGDDFFDLPFRSGRPAFATVSAASDARLDGRYASDDARLTHVFRFRARGSTPETCRFQFEGLRQPATDAFMSGEIQYLPGTDNLFASFFVVEGREFRVDGNNGVRLDRASNSIVYQGAVLASTQGTGQTITLDGSIPMRNEDKPSGC